jgi:hypothetical protein
MARTSHDAAPMRISAAPARLTRSRSGHHPECRAWSGTSRGLALTAVLVPVGMGYAAAAGLPAIHGLYATIVPLIAYAVFGPSRILVLGPDSSLAALIAVTVVPLAAGDSAQAVALARPGPSLVCSAGQASHAWASSRPARNPSATATSTASP